MDRHLLPEEIDQLLDGELGFGTAPLKAHVRVCAECHAELEAARTLVQHLEHLPLMMPTPGFANRVMADVQIFVPWHVALLDTARGWIPRSRAGKVLAWSTLSAASIVLTLCSLWILTQLDTVIFAIDMGLHRLQGATTGAFTDLVATLFGAVGVQALRANGLAGTLIVLAVLFVSAVMAARLLRAVIIGARHR